MYEGDPGCDAAPFSKIALLPLLDLYEACVLEPKHSEHQEEILELLIDYGVSLHREDSMGQSPVHYAALKANEKAMKWLIQKGAKLEVVDHQGLNVLHYYAYTRTLQLQQWRELFKALKSIEGGSGGTLGLGIKRMLHQKNSNGIPPLQLSIDLCPHELQDTALIELLVQEMGISFKEIFESDLDILHLASQHGSDEMLVYLVEKVMQCDWEPGREVEQALAVLDFRGPEGGGFTPRELALKTGQPIKAGYLEAVILSLRESKAIEEVLMKAMEGANGTEGLNALGGPRKVATPQRKVKRSASRL